MSRLVAGLVGAVVLALLVSEVAMAPTSGDRVVLATVFAGTAAAAAVVGAWLRTRAATARSLSRTFTVLAVTAIAVAATIVALAAVSMFLSPHDLRLVMIALGLGLGVAIALVSAALAPIRRDLAAVTAAAERLGRGELLVATGVRRNDELGTLATTLDDLAGRLEAAAALRRRDEASRRSLLIGISHDLRTPLTSARVAIEAVHDGIAPDVPRYLATAARDLESAGRLVDDLFLLARAEVGDLQLDRMPVDLTEVADGVVEELAPLAERRRIQLVVAPQAPVRADADPHALGRVIRNLVANAVEHAPSGSAVRIEIRSTSDAAEIAVVDEGPGFPDDLVDRVGIAPVERGGSSGFGLAVAGGLVRAHGGDLVVSPGPGGRVALRLPTNQTAVGTT
jgi:signal transduction histidine kinase